MRPALTRYYYYGRGGGYSETPIDITGKSNLEAFGDSITVGQAASPSSNSYVNLFNTEKVGITTLRNNAVSGRGVYNQAALLPGLAFTKSSTTLLTMIGLNDIRRGGNNAKTFTKIEACYRTIILKGIKKDVTASGAAAVTRTGTINGFNASLVGGAFGTGTIPGNVATNAPAQTNGAATWTWPFTGTAFGIQFSCSDGVISTYGNARVYIDDVLVRTVALNNIYDGISDGANDNARGPTVETFHNLSNTLHSVRVEADGSGNVPIDFFATLSDFTDVCAMIFCEIPYLNDAGYAIVPDSGSVAISNTGSAVIRDLVTEYKRLGYPIVYVPVNDYYDLTTGVSVDNIHPNNTGHAQLFNAVNASVI